MDAFRLLTKVLHAETERTKQAVIRIRLDIWPEAA